MNRKLGECEKTRLRILRAVTEPIEEMTVSQISSAAGVSRQTFYSLFASKYDIAHWYLKEAESRFLVEIGRTLSLADGISSYFKFLERERPYLANAFERKPDKRELRERLDHLVNEMIQTASGKGAVVDEDFRFCVSYTVESADCLVASWCLHGGVDDDAGTMARRLEMCIPQRLAALSDPESHSAKRPASDD